MGGAMGPGMASHMAMGGPGGPMGPMGPMGNHVMPNGPLVPTPTGAGPVALPTTPLPKSSGNKSPINNSISSAASTNSNSVPTPASTTPPSSARATPPTVATAPSHAGGPPPSSITSGRGPPIASMQRMPMGGAGGPMVPGSVGGPPRGGQMYGGPGGHPNMMSDVRSRAQSRYRLGNPSASSMRQPMPGGPAGVTVPPGQHSPMHVGGGVAGNVPPGMMANQGMRQQVNNNNITFLKVAIPFIAKLTVIVQ